MTKGRLEAFSDGVIAIIITIMVLEIKVPHGTEWTALAELWPTMLSYVISFVYVGIYWGNHHHMLHTMTRVSPRIIWANMLLLFFLSLVPFATDWMGENHFAKNPVILYAVLMCLCGVSFNILQATIQRANPMTSAMKAAYRMVMRKGIVSALCYLSAIGTAFIDTRISTLLFVVVAVMWFIPDRHLEKALVEEENAGETEKP